jgi:hypothetical protein
MTQCFPAPDSAVLMYKIIATRKPEAVAMLCVLAGKASDTVIFDHLLAGESFPMVGL